MVEDSAEVMETVLVSSLLSLITIMVAMSFSRRLMVTLMLLLSLLQHLTVM